MDCSTLGFTLELDLELDTTKGGNEQAFSTQIRSKGEGKKRQRKQQKQRHKVWAPLELAQIFYMA